MNSNNPYSNNYSDNENINSNTTNYSHHTHYQSMDTITQNKPSGITLIINAMKIILISIGCILFLLVALAKVTHGKTLFLDRVEGEIIEREFVTTYHTLSEHTTKSRIKISYIYKDKEYTIVRECDAVKSVGEKVYVYVNILNPTTVLYYDPLSTSFFLVPMIIFIFVVLYQKFVKDGISLSSSRSWW